MGTWSTAAARALAAHPVSDPPPPPAARGRAARSKPRVKEPAAAAAVPAAGGAKDKRVPGRVLTLRPLAPPAGDLARFTCGRCAHACKHVARDFCPNCGVGVFLDLAATRVYYPQGQGCGACAIPGTGGGAEAAAAVTR